MAVVTPESVATISEPGVYDIPAEDYHLDCVAGGSLSSTGARRLLPPSCPAKFKWDYDHRAETQPINRNFNLGHAAHKLVLGAGPELVAIDADSYRGKAAKGERDEALAAGLVPLLSSEHDQVHEMAQALKGHPLASVLFDPARGGKPEQTLVWRDEPTGVMCRARLDWLPQATGGRLIIPDYKTTASADPEFLGRAVYQHGYHQQDDFYTAGARALGLANEDSAFVFVAQEKDAPFLVTVFELDSTARLIGAIRNRRALQIYAHCTHTGHWPGHVDEKQIALLSLPPWAEREEGDLP